MEINYTISGCSITILNNSDIYATTQTTASLFRYEDTKTINVLKQITLSGNTLTTNIINHDDSISSYQTTYSPGLDGYFNIYHIIIPTLSWLQDQITKQVNSDPHAMLSLYTSGIYYIKEDGKIYKYIYNASDFTSINTAGSLVLTASTEISIDTLISLNIDNTYSLLKNYKSIFFICNLKDCYLNYCNNIFNKKLTGCECDSMKQDIFSRDLIWMTINVITMLIEDNNYEQAETYLEKIQGCNGICSNVDCSSSINQTSCGCN